MAKTGEGRVFLLLQGPMSWFFSYLGGALRAEGAAVRRLLVCPGDALFWRGGGATAYRGRPDDWPAFLEAFMRREGVTDIVCLGDGRRWHDEGLPVARRLGARIHVIEQGYIRPHFLTVEPEGTGGRTRFPRDWPAIEALAAGAAPPAPPAYRASFFWFSVMDVAFNLANILASWALYPHYRQHAVDHPLTEWSGWIVKKALPIRQRRRTLAKAEARVARHAGPLYILPLQLETDYQIRLHGPPGGVRGVVEATIASFAAKAPEDALLAIKAHPLDNGWADWAAAVRSAAGRRGVSERCVFLDGGDLDAMLKRAAGVVVVNSTVGLTALEAGAPVIALGTAIYDLPGLTHQGALDTFWTEAAPPEAARFQTLIAALGATIQAPGGFDGTGAKPGAAAMAAKMLAPPPY